MNICLVSSSYPPQTPARYCGIGDYTSRLATAVASSELQIHILTETRYAGPALPGENLHVHPLIARWQLQELGRLDRFWRQQQIDLVHIQYQPELLGSRWSPFNATLSWLAGRDDRPVVTTLHTIANPSPYSPTRLTARYLIRASNHLISTHQSQMMELIRHWGCPPAKLSLIPVGSNVTPSQQQLGNRSDIRNGLRKRLGVAADELLLAHFGRFYPGKGVETLLLALAQLRAEGVPARLLLLGHLPRREEAYQAELAAATTEAAEAGHIIQLEDLPAPAVSNHLLAADLYVVPYSEGLTTRRTSAMAGFAHQLPVISTMGPKLPDYFRPGENLLLVPPDNVKALAGAIRQMYEQPTLRQRLATAGQTITARYSWETIAGQHADLWRQLMR